MFISWMEQLNTAILRNPRPNASQAARVGNTGGNNNKSKTESDIARTRATADATKDLRANAAKMGLGAQRSFA